MFRTFSAILLLVSLASTASAATLYPLPDPLLHTAANLYRQGSFTEAVEAAGKAADGGMKELLIGAARYQQKEWPSAVEHLEKASRSFPLLADFSLYYLSDSLYQLARYDEAATALQKLLKEYPSSPVARSAEILRADALCASKRPKEAYEAYQKFIERYAAGADAIHAALNAALCRKETGQPDKAALELHALRIANPDTDMARKAEEELSNLAAAGVQVPRMTAEESARVGSALFGKKKYEKAAAIFRSLSSSSLPAETRRSLSLKTGQALFRNKKYQEAEATFCALLRQELDRSTRCETEFWLARTVEKEGKENEAYAAYLRLAETYPENELAREALMQAAYLKKFQGKREEARTLFEKLVKSATNGRLGTRALWELAWESYLAGDYRNAVDLFRQLSVNDSYREKSLYWQAIAMQASGEPEGAGKLLNQLVEESPRGFYALQYRKKIGKSADNGSSFHIEPGLAEKIELPSGFERARALIALGMYEEARKDLQAERKKTGTKKAQLGLIRLYLAMDDYHAPLSIVSQGALGKIKRDDPMVLGLSYPLAFQDIVTKYTASNTLSRSLVYSLIRAESQFNMNARSPVGAVGLMQLMPSTAKALEKGSGRKQSTTSQLTRPEYNIRLGTRHLKGLLKEYNGDLVAAIAAYNAGGVAVERWRKAFGNLREDEFIENIPYAETREYVKKVLSTADLYNRLYNLDGIQTAPPVDLPDADEQKPATEQAGTHPDKQKIPSAQTAASPLVESQLHQLGSPTGSN